MVNTIPSEKSTKQMFNNNVYKMRTRNCVTILNNLRRFYFCGKTESNIFKLLPFLTNAFSDMLLINTFYFIQLN